MAPAAEGDRRRDSHTASAGLNAERLPASACAPWPTNLVLDVFGLCLAGETRTMWRAALDGVDGDGALHVIGHARPLDSAGAAPDHGTAAHGEDFDDTFEGGRSMPAR